MTTISLTKLLGSAALFLTMVIQSTALAERECKDGICIQSTDTVIDGKAAKVVSFSGFPRAGDYVTNFYNVILPGQDQRESDHGEHFVLFGTSTVSVQACRRLYSDLIGPHTKCAGWVRFTVEVSPGPAASTSEANTLKDFQRLKGRLPKPTPTPRPIGVTGKTQAPAIPSSGDASGAAPAQGAPVITANPRTVSVPAGQGEGATTLTWDGGSEHPYAEVWVGVDGADPTFVVEQGKGTRRVTVEPGKTYRYILTDSGKDLATVTVKSK